VLVISEPDVRQFVTRRRARDGVIVIQGGVDIAESERWLNGGGVVPVEKRKYDACFFGRLHHQKNVLGLLEMWRLVCRRRPNALLAIVGDGHQEREVREKIKTLGLEKHVEMLGFMDGADRFEVFKQTKIMVHPSIHDSGAIATAEAMAWQLPGVCFDLPAYETYFPQGMVKTPCFDTQRFVDNVLRLLTDAEFYNQNALAARGLIVNVWDWKKRADTLWRDVFKQHA